MTLTSTDIHCLVQAMILSGVPIVLWLIPYVKTFLPLVILQIATGIVVGPSVLGWAWPSFETWLFSGQALYGLQAMAFWGVTFFVFYTGLHIEKEMFFGPRATKEFWILSIASLFIPFAIGCLLGWIFIDVWFDTALLGPGTRVTYILAIGVTVGVTALPVLSAILMEIGKLETDLGILLLATSTVHDVSLWLLITIIFGLSGNSSNWAGVYQPLASIGVVFALLLVLWFAYNPLMKRVCQHAYWLRLSTVPRLTITLLLMYLAGITTEAVNVHTLVGIVMFGACVPVSEKPFVMGHIDTLNRALFLPLFFGNAGISVTLNNSSGRTGYIFATMTLASIIGQIPGSLLIARLFKRTWKQALIVYVFLLCKGGVGITVATLMLTGQIIDNNTFSGMMLMALALTAITKPAIWAILRWFPGDEDPFDLGVGKKAGLTETAESLGPAPGTEEEVDVVKPTGGAGGPGTFTLGEFPDQEDPRLPNPYAFLTQQGDRVSVPYFPDYQASSPELSVPNTSYADLEMSSVAVGRNLSMNSRVVKNY